MGVKSFEAKNNEPFIFLDSENLKKYLKGVSEKNYAENKSDIILKEDDVNQDYHYFPKNQNLIKTLRGFDSNMFDIYSKDSILIKGKNQNILIHNYISKFDDRDFRFVDSVSEYRNHLFFHITGYEIWEIIVVNIEEKEVYSFPDYPVLINSNEYLVVSDYY